MDGFELRGRQIRVVSAPVYESSRWEAPKVSEISYEVVTVYGLILGTRTQASRSQEAYAYIDESGDSARGIWLSEADYAPEPGPM